MKPILIVEITVDSVDKLQKIGQQTFFDTFVGTTPKEDMQTYLKESFAIEKLTKELENEDTQFYFAMLEDEVIGYLKINVGDAQTELQDKHSLEIERIYVSKEFHGKDVGQLLYNKALEVATRIGVDYIWLGVWGKNLKALRFYEKNGFEIFGEHTFVLGSDIQTDMMMKLKLR